MTMFFASVLIWLMFFGLVVLWVIDGPKKKEMVLHAIFACILSWAVSELIKYFFPTLRPFMINNLDPLTLTVPTDGAFPSSHTAVSFALSISIIKHHKKIGILYLLMSLLVGIARILANVHYPIDIIGGAVIGTAISQLTSSRHFARLLKK